MTLPEIKLCLNHLYHRINPLHALHGMILAWWPRDGEVAKLLIANPATDAVQHLQGHLMVDKLELPGKQLLKKVSVISANTLLQELSHQVVLVQATEPLTISLPVGVPAGVSFVIKDQLGNFDTHALTVAPAGAETIDGQASLVLNTPFASVELMATGTGWVTL